MSETKHTPGPWRFEGDFGIDCLQVEIGAELPFDYICTVTPIYDEVWREDDIANVHLIAAAPELLNACRVVTAFLDKLENGTDESDPLAQLRRQFHAPLRAALNPAIAKAEGRA